MTAAGTFAPEESDPHQSQLRAYKALLDEDLFTVQAVKVCLDEKEMPGRPHTRVTCDECAEDVNDGREVAKAGRTLCKACAAGGYYTLAQ